MKPRLRNTLLALGMLCFLGAEPAAAQLTPQDSTDIRAIAGSALASLSSGDAATYAGLFSEDAILQPPNAPTVRGRTALEAWARGFPTAASLTWPNERLSGHGDVAYVTSDYVFQLAAMPSDRGKQLGVYRRDEGGNWQIAAVSYNSDLPPQREAVASHETAAAVLYSVWNTKEYERLDDALAPDFRRQGSDGGAEGLVAWKVYMRQIHTTYPDFHIDVHESAYDGDIGVTRWTITGTDARTARKIEVSGMSLLRFENGMITEQIAYFDPAPLRAHLGLEALLHAR